MANPRNNLKYLWVRWHPHFLSTLKKMSSKSTALYTAK
ncbi:hypothetical protein CF65_02723 [Aggregatibacter actinomycetemcomitans HK1651]|nr:hypothetical protein CF65_02723 [Aggregatibacter actinomycetemcomitans HK1651]